MNNRSTPGTYQGHRITFPPSHLPAPKIFLLQLLVLRLTAGLKLTGSRVPGNEASVVYNNMAMLFFCQLFLMFTAMMPTVRIYYQRGFETTSYICCPGDDLPSGDEHLQARASQLLVLGQVILPGQDGCGPAFPSKPKSFYNICLQNFWTSETGEYFVS